MSKYEFKVGDKVIVIKNNHCGNEKGTILTVCKKQREEYTDTSYDGKRCIYFKETSLYNTEDELKLISSGDDKPREIKRSVIIYTDNF